jgi:protein-S-isoprenylcysteine O-methyltransferase Ste14
MSFSVFLARRRVSLGFLFALAILYFAHPTWHSLAQGAAVGLVGEAVRFWAAGHLEKSREVTMSGPYRVTRHPLYVGSSIMAAGVIIGCRSLVVATLVAAYMGTTLTAAIRTEEAFLRREFGDAYDAYATSRVPHAERQFSLSRVWRNREYRAIGGSLLFLLLLVARMYAASIWPN